MLFLNGIRYNVMPNGFIPNALLVQLREVHDTDHKGDRFFRLDQRAKIKLSQKEKQ